MPEGVHSQSTLKNIIALVVLGVGSLIAVSFFAKDLALGISSGIQSQSFIAVVLILGGLYWVIKKVASNQGIGYQEGIAAALIVGGLVLFQPQLGFVVLSSLGLNVPNLNLSTTNVMTVVIGFGIAGIIYFAIKKVRKG